MTSANRRCTPDNTSLGGPALRRRAPLVNGFCTVLLQDLPAKTAHQIIRSVTWTEVGSSLRATTGFRASISRAAKLGRRFLDPAALLVDILRGIIKVRTFL
jgi:hypothetical protein